MIDLERQVINKSYDVIVAGGGPAGTAAAIASARNGASTLLIERYGFLGGMGTVGLVNPFMNYYAGSKKLVRGIFEEVTERLKKANAFGGCGQRLSFDTEELKYILQDMICSSGAHLLLHTFVSDSKVSNGTIEEITTVSKSGNCVYKGQIYIDCTGDGDLAFKSNAKYMQGRDSDGYCQPATLMFIMGGVRTDEESVEFPVDEEYGLPQGRVLFFKLPREGLVIVNMTRAVKVNGTDAEDLTLAEIQTRKQVREIINYLKNNVKGFENAYLLQTASQIGIRETRRIEGEYILTADDVLRCRKFSDGVVMCNYNIDIHNPTGTGTIIKKLPEKNWYEIPYRCLIPKGISNLLVAGRCISATHEALSSLRIQPTCYALGEVAGTAAALAVKKCVSPQYINVSELQTKLSEQGAW